MSKKKIYCVLKTKFRFSIQKSFLLWHVCHMSRLKLFRMFKSEIKLLKIIGIKYLIYT